MIRTTATLAAVGILCPASAADPSPFTPIFPGTPLAVVEHRVGRAHMSAGGPSSPLAAHFEMSGPAAATITGASDRPIYLVFERPSPGRQLLLTHAHWNMNQATEHELRRAIARQESGVREFEGARCSSLGRGAVLALAEAASSWGRQAVLEASKSFRRERGLTGNQVRPTYADLCPQTPG